MLENWNIKPEAGGLGIFQIGFQSHIERTQEGPQNSGVQAVGQSTCTCSTAVKDTKKKTSPLQLVNLKSPLLLCLDFSNPRVDEAFRFIPTRFPRFLQDVQQVASTAFAFAAILQNGQARPAALWHRGCQKRASAVMQSVLGRRPLGCSFANMLEKLLKTAMKNRVLKVEP